MKKTLSILLGCISMVLGAMGAFFPILPSTPFLLLAAFCFAKSSQRLHNWFLNTRLYKNHLESYARGEGMTRGTKARILISVTLLMGLACFFTLRKDVIFPCILLALVWVGHLIYFLLGVKTYHPDKS